MHDVREGGGERCARSFFIAHEREREIMTQSYCCRQSRLMSTLLLHEIFVIQDYARRPACFSISNEVFC